MDNQSADGTGELARSAGAVVHSRKLRGYGDAIRQGFYKIDSYDGLIKHYKTPFTPDNHDALGEDDYIWTRFIGHEILPVEMAAK